MAKENCNTRHQSMKGHYIGIILHIFSAVKLTADSTIELRKILHKNHRYLLQIGIYRKQDLNRGLLYVSVACNYMTRR